jgi:hypothetical protein
MSKTSTPECWICARPCQRFSARLVSTGRWRRSDAAPSGRRLTGGGLRSIRVVTFAKACGDLVWQ